MPIRFWRPSPRRRIAAKHLVASAAVLILGVSLLMTSVLLVRPAVVQAHSLAPYQGQRLDTFFIVNDSDGHRPYGMYHVWSDDQGTTWSGLESLGTPGSNLFFFSAPSAVSDAPGHIELFALAGALDESVMFTPDDNLRTANSSAIYSDVFDHGHWSGWFPWSGQKAFGYLFSSAPATTSWGPGRMELFVYGYDLNTGGKALLHTWADQGAWSGNWEVLGTGNMQESPAAVSPQPGRDDVFVRGAGGELDHKGFANGQWSSGWANLGGTYLYSPAVASWAPSRLDVIVVGTDHVPYRLWSDDGGTTWSSPISLGGAASSFPAAISVSTGRLDVFMRGTDGHPYHQGFNNTTPFGWESLSTDSVSALASVAWIPVAPPPPTPSPSPFPHRCTHPPCRSDP